MVDKLERQKSTIPTSCTQTESSVIRQPITKVWAQIKAFALHELAPTMFKSSSFEHGSHAGQVGAHVTLEYQDGPSWKISVTEVSDKHFSLCYEVVDTTPAIDVTSVQVEFKLYAVTDTQQTFIQWTTEYSNDVGLEVISDQKYKKRDFFAAIN